MTTNLSDFLAHFGTKGMKWGVRKDVAGISNFSGGGVITTAGKKANAASKSDHRKAFEATTNTMTKLICSPTEGVMRPNGPGMQLSMAMQKKYGDQTKAPKSARDEYETKMAAITEKEAQGHAPKGAHARVIRLSRVDEWLLIVGSKKLVDELADEHFVRHSDSDLAQVTLRLERDSNGWISGITQGEPALSHFDASVLMSDVDENDLKDALAHYGIKGMKWGVRRTDAQLAATQGKPSGKLEKLDTKAVQNGVSKSGSASDKSSDDVKLSEDAANFVKTRMKSGSEMSDAEIRNAINRANMVKQYDEMFAPSPSASLKQKVELLRLKKEYGQLQAEMNPSLTRRVGKLVGKASSGYAAYVALNKATDGALDFQIQKSLGLTTSAPKHRASTAPKKKKNK